MYILLDFVREGNICQRSRKYLVFKSKYTKKYEDSNIAANKKKKKKKLAPNGRERSDLLC